MQTMWTKGVELCPCGSSGSCRIHYVVLLVSLATLKQLSYDQALSLSVSLHSTDTTKTYRGQPNACEESRIIGWRRHSFPPNFEHVDIHLL